MINDTISPNQTLISELLLLPQLLKSRWECCPPVSAALLDLAICFSRHIADTWLTKQGPKERDTLLTPQTKVLQRFGWGFFSETATLLFLCPGATEKLLELNKLCRVVSRVSPLAVRWHYFWWLFCLFLISVCFFCILLIEKERSWVMLDSFWKVSSEAYWQFNKQMEG